MVRAPEFTAPAGAPVSDVDPFSITEDMLRRAGFEQGMRVLDILMSAEWRGPNP